MYIIIFLLIFAVRIDCLFTPYGETDIYANRSSEVILVWKYIPGMRTLYTIKCQFNNGIKFVDAVIKFNQNGEIQNVSVSGISTFEPYTESNVSTTIGIKLLSVRKTDPTQYMCLVAFQRNGNLQIQDSQIKTLHVLDPPMFISCLSGNTSLGPIKYNEDLMISCYATGDPQPNLQCYLEDNNNKTLKSLPTSKQTRNITESFTNVTRFARFVRCVADSGKAGRIEIRKRVIVKHPPFVPRNFMQVRSNETSIKVRWLPLGENERGGDILNYFIEYHIENNLTNKYSVSLPNQPGNDTYPNYKKEGEFFTYEIMGVDTSSYYTFSVFANNAEGNGSVASIEKIRPWHEQHCPPNQYHCMNMECIPNELKCDTKIDCSDGSDETSYANCSTPDAVKFTIVPLYDGFSIKLSNVLSIDYHYNVTMIVNINGKTGLNITLNDNMTVFGVKRMLSSTQNDVFHHVDFMPGVESTVYVYATNYLGMGPISMKSFQTLGPIVGGKPMLISTTKSSIKVNGTALHGINDATIVSHTFEIKGPINKSVTVLGNATRFSFMFEGLERITTYLIRYKVNDTDGESEFSMWGRFTTDNFEIPQSPTNFTGRSRRNEIKLTWTPAIGEEIQYLLLNYSLMSTPNLGNYSKHWSKQLKNDMNMYTVSELMANSTYTFNLTAVNSAGQGKPATLEQRTDMAVCPGYDWDYFDGHCYYAGDNTNMGVDQNEAITKCMNMTSSLASILSMKENENVVEESMSISTSLETAYIGLSRTSNDTYAWLDKSPYSFQQYKNMTYDPNSVCTVIDTTSGYWMNVACGSKHGFICKRKTAFEMPLQIKLKHIGFDRVYVTLPRTSFKKRMMLVYVDGKMYNNSMNFYTGDEIIINGLKELTNYTIRAREDFQGMGPWTKELNVMTRAFIHPGKPMNISDETVMYAESRSRSIFWKYGQLGDSILENLKLHIRYCTISNECQTEMFKTSPSNLTRLQANTTYNYTLYAFDTKNNQMGMKSDVMTFRTAEKDTCRTDHWLCEGGSICVSNTSLCDGKMDCPIIGNSRFSVDELEVAGCQIPTMVNITETIAGFDFVRLYWTQKPINERVLYYVVLLNGMQYNVSANSTTFRLNLENGTQYEISIFAMNPTGNGPTYTLNVTTGNSTSPTGPVSMLNQMGVIWKENMARIVKWEKPKELGNNDPEMLYYKLKWCFHMESNCSMIVLKNKLTYQIDNLIPERNYILQVTVINEYNQSSRLVSVNFSTPLCNSNEFKCARGKQCIPKTNRCDGEKQCSDMSDELPFAGCSVPAPVNMTLLIGLTFIKVRYTGQMNKPMRFKFMLRNSLDNVVFERNVTDTTENGMFSVTNLTIGSKYTLLAFAVNYVGQGNSTIKNFTTKLEADQPSPPQNPIAKPTTFQESSSVDLTWDSPMYGGGVLPSKLTYRVQYCKVVQECKMQNTTEMTATIKGLMPNSTYNISIFAIAYPNIQGFPANIQYITLEKDECKNSTNYFQCPVRCILNVLKCNGVQDCQDGSDETLAAGCSAPGKVENLKNRTLWDSITFSWTKPIPESFVTGYYLQLSCTNSATRDVKLLANETTFTFEQLTNSATTVICNLSIRAENLAGNGTIMTGIYQTAVLLPPSKPIQPTEIPTIGLESQSVHLSWNPPLNLGNSANHQITYSVKWCFSSSACNSTIVTDTFIKLDGLNKNTMYEVTITPVDVLGQSGASLKFSFKTSVDDSLPSKPLNVRAKEHKDDPSKKIMVSWDPPTNLSGIAVEDIVYEVEYCKNNRGVCKTITTTRGVTTITLVDLTKDKEYSITVKARGLNGKFGLPSDVVNYSTKDTRLPVYAIALIVIGCFFVLLIAFIIILKSHFKTRYGSKAYSISQDANSHMNDAYSDEGV